MVNRPKVSIIIPVYNAERTLDKCLNSIVNQTEHNIEIVLVDDMSTDCSRDLLKEWTKTDNRIKVLFNKENVGTFMTRKRGVLIANGEYIMFADNDDWYEANACEELYDEIKKRNVDILMYGAKAIVENEDDVSKLDQTRKQKGLKVISESIRREHCVTEKNRMNMLWNKIIKAEVCRKAYENSENVYLTVAEDTYACWLIHFYAKSFDTLDKKYYNWNVETGYSTVEKRSLEDYKRFCRCMVCYEDATRRFLATNDAPQNVIDRFEKDNPIRRRYCINQWKKTVSRDDAVEAFRFLCSCYSEQEIIEAAYLLFIDTDKVRDNAIIKVSKTKEEMDKLKIELRNTNNSKARKIGRSISFKRGNQKI